MKRKRNDESPALSKIRRTDNTEDGNTRRTSDGNLRHQLNAFLAFYGQDGFSDDPEKKPYYSYVEMVYMAIMASPNLCLTVPEVYVYLQEKFAYFRETKLCWKNSVRHSLSKTKCFQKLEIDKHGQSERRHRLLTFWTIEPSSVAEFARGKFRSCRLKETHVQRLGDFSVNGDSPVSWTTVEDWIREKLHEFRRILRERYHMHKTVQPEGDCAKSTESMETMIKLSPPSCDPCELPELLDCSIGPLEEDLLEEFSRYIPYACDSDSGISDTLSTFVCAADSADISDSDLPDVNTYVQETAIPDVNTYVQETAIPDGSSGTQDCDKPNSKTSRCFNISYILRDCTDNVDSDSLTADNTSASTISSILSDYSKDFGARIHDNSGSTHYTVYTAKCDVPGVVPTVLEDQNLPYGYYLQAPRNDNFDRFSSGLSNNRNHGSTYGYNFSYNPTLSAVDYINRGIVSAPPRTYYEFNDPVKMQYQYPSLYHQTDHCTRYGSHWHL